MKCLQADSCAETIAATLTNRDGCYSQFAYLSEARRMGLKVLLPDINESRTEWWGKDRTLRVGLMQLKGLDETALEAILNERTKRPFRSFEDFLLRVEICVSDVKLLVKSGAFDRISRGATRPELIWTALASNQRRLSGRPVMRSLFDDQPLMTQPQIPQYSPRTILQHEFETLDLLISRHPLSLYPQSLAKLRYVKAVDLPRYSGARVTTVGWLVTGRPEPAASASFDDTSALYETIFFPHVHARLCQILSRVRPYVLTGVVQEERRLFRLFVDSVRLL